MRRELLLGATCFLLGSAAFVWGQSSGLRPDQFVARPWTWSGGVQDFTTGVTVGTSFTATGLVTVADLASPATTVNGQTCTLGSSCTVSASAASITVGTTTINSGTNGKLEFNNSGVLGELGVGAGLVTSGGNVTLDVTHANVWAATQTFGDGDLILSGASSGSSTLKAASTGGGTATLPAGSGTLVYSTGISPGSLSLTNTHILVGNVSNVAADVAMSQDCTVSNTGVVTCLKTNNVAFTTAATTAIGTNGATIPLLNTANTWSGAQSFNNADFILKGSSSGTTTVEAAAAAGSTVQTFQAATGTVADLDVADQTISGGANVTSLSQSAGNITVDCGARPTQYMTNSGAFTITAPSSDGACYLDVENGGSAGAVSLSGFSPNTMGGATLDTTNGHNFRLVISRVHGHSSIFAVALQ